MKKALLTRWVIAFRYRSDHRLRCHLAAYDPNQTVMSGRRRSRRRKWKKSGPNRREYRFKDLQDAKRALSCSIAREMLGARDARLNKTMFYAELVECVYEDKLFAKPIKAEVLQRIGVSPLEQLALEASK